MHNNKPPKYWCQQVQVVACLMISLFLLSLPGCKKDKIDKTPSQSGANTLYFEAEGKEWTPRDEYMVFDASVEYKSDSLFYMVIFAENIEDKDFYAKIKIDLFNVKHASVYHCNENVKFLSYDKLYPPANSNKSKFCTGCLIRDETINITKLDTTAKIISGTFSFVAQCQDSSLVEVKNGWFDYHYPYNK